MVFGIRVGGKGRGEGVNVSWVRGVSVFSEHVCRSRSSRLTSSTELLRLRYSSASGYAYVLAFVFRRVFLRLCRATHPFIRLGTRNSPYKERHARRPETEEEAFRCRKFIPTENTSAKGAPYKAGTSGTRVSIYIYMTCWLDRGSWSDGDGVHH